MRKILIIVLDGCSNEYISNIHTPNLVAMGNVGFHKTVKATMPTVTNVNHATILTGKFPVDHHIVGNYFYNKETGEQGFIDSTDFMKSETVLDIMHDKGKSTALLTVKGKILDVFGKNVDIGVSVEKPDQTILSRLKMPQPPPVGTLEANEWILQACYSLIKQEDPDIVYCTTNDFMMHRYDAQEKEAINGMQKIDRWIGEIYKLNRDREIYITADHGMNAKRQLVDVQKIMNNRGYDPVFIPPLKDRYIENHLYQEGGTLYLYFKQNTPDSNRKEVLSILSDFPFIERILSKSEAAVEFYLPSDGIGDYILIAGEDHAFAELSDETLITNNVRTHGSLYEQEVPLIAVNAQMDNDYYHYSRDIVANIL